ncbi:MAG: histidine kinase, partial [Bacteroidota bacterium]
MKKPLILLLHLGFWFLYLLLITVLLYAIFQGVLNAEEEIDEVIAVSFFFMAVIPAVVTFYAFYLFLFPHFFRQRKFSIALLYGALIALATTSCGYAILAFLIYPECVAEADADFIPGVIATLSLTNFLCGMVALIFQGFFTWFEEVKLKEELMQKNHAMELALVKSQLDPHFLFNTLNNIDTLILKSAEDASEYLNRLSDIMRFMLYETKTREISLQREVEYIRKYIALQK